MRKGFTRVGLAVGVVAMLAGSGIGHTAATACAHSDASSKPNANNVIATDGANCVLEPILTRSDKAPVFVNDGDADGLGQSNIKGLNFRTDPVGKKIIAQITTAKPIPQNINQLATPGSQTYVRAPYGGVHVLVLFQTPTLNLQQTLGTTLSGGTTTLGPLRTEDNYHWFLYYGITVSSGGNPTCGVGFYDTFGQFFTTLSQKFDTPQNYTCANNGAGVITLTFPYKTTWTLQPDNLARQVEIVRSTNTISNIKAFSWTDHEVGGPPPVGLVIGATWYTDVVPSNGYDFGLIAGDPNSGGVPGPKCGRVAIVGNIPNPQADGTPCYAQMPTAGGEYAGLGMKGTSLNVVA